MASNNNRSPADIEREIAETRVQMGHTVDVLKHKVSPERIRARTVDRFRPKGSMLDMLKANFQRNPMLYSLIGTAVLWRLMSSRSSGGPSRRELEQIRAQAAEDAYWRHRAALEREQRESARAMGRQMRGAAKRSWRDMRGRAAELGGQLRGRGQQMREQVQGRAEQMQGQAQQMGSDLEQGWEHYTSYDHGRSQSSMLPALIGIAAGVIMQAMGAQRAARRPARRHGSMRGTSHQGWQAPSADATESMAADSGLLDGDRSRRQSMGPGSPSSPGLEDRHGPADRSH